MEGEDRRKEGREGGRWREGGIEKRRREMTVTCTNEHIYNCTI